MRLPILVKPMQLTKKAVTLWSPSTAQMWSCAIGKALKLKNGIASRQMAGLALFAVHLLLTVTVLTWDMTVTTV